MVVNTSAHWIDLKVKHRGNTKDSVVEDSDLQDAPNAKREKHMSPVLRVSLDASLDMECSMDMNIKLDQRNICVIDDFISEDCRKSILDWLLERRESDGSGETVDVCVNAAPSTLEFGGKWERLTACDPSCSSSTWGLCDEALKELMDNPIDAIIDVQTKVCELFPSYRLVHMPIIREKKECQNNGKSSKKGNPDTSPEFHISYPFVGNAVVSNDSYHYHLDASSAGFLPENLMYFQRRESYPFLFSLILYLNEEWDLNWGGETQFLDPSLDVGVFVHPKPCRAVLMDADVKHKINPTSKTSASAQHSPRYSLVWKIIALPQIGIIEDTLQEKMTCIRRYGVNASKFESDDDNVIDVNPFGTVHNALCIGRKELRKDRAQEHFIDERSNTDRANTASLCKKPKLT